MRRSHVQSSATGRGVGFTLLASATLLIGANLEAQAEEEFDGRVVNIRMEPRHRTVHRDGDIYLLDVQINPGDTSLAHEHDAAIMLTFISSGDGPRGGSVSSNTDYVTENFTHQVSNPGPHLLRIIALTNYGPAISGSGDRPDGMVGEPQLENEWFRSYRIDLAPGEMTAPQRHLNPTVVVQVSDGVTHVTREDGITGELTEMGDWAWRDPGSPFQIRNAGNRPLSVVVNEARRTVSEP